MIWGTSPQECMVQNEGHFLKAFAAPSDVLRASWEGPATVEDAKRVLSAVFRPPALLVQATVFAGSQALGYFLDLAPTRFENEMARIRINGGWHPMSSRRGGSKAAWQGEIQWRSIDALRELLREHGVRLSVLLMPIDEQSVKKEAAIRRKFTLSLADYCRRHEIPYVDLFDAPYRLEKTDYMADGRHIVVHGARKLSGEIARRVVVPMLRADGQQGGQDVGSNVQSRVRIETLQGPIRLAYLPAEDEPVTFGVHGEVARHYGVPEDYDHHATTLDYVVAAAGG